MEYYAILLVTISKQDEKEEVVKIDLLINKLPLLNDIQIHNFRVNSVNYFADKETNTWSFSEPCVNIISEKTEIQEKLSQHCMGNDQNLYIYLSEISDQHICRN